METTDAIAILQTEAQNLGVEIDRKTALKNAMDVAAKQLQGTLQTQITALEEARAEISNLEQAALPALEVANPINSATSTPMK